MNFIKYIKYIIIILFVLLASTMYSQTSHKPCADLQNALMEIEKLIVNEEYNQALEILDRLKNRPELSVCDDYNQVVYKINAIRKIHLGCPDNNHPHAIDLGLPSGTKWACCNVGAKKPEEHGSYYAWGETEEKDLYDESNYLFYNGDNRPNNKYTIIGTGITGTEYDVAHLKWGGKWQMPTVIQNKELIENCTYRWTTYNGIEGGRFFSKHNNNSIFLPAAGYYCPELGCCGREGSYATGTLHDNYNGCMYDLRFNKDNVHWKGTALRCYGSSVRPVIYSDSLTQLVETFLEEAKQGNVDAQYNLAQCYLDGIGVPQDDKQAVAWFQKAAEQEDVDAQLNIGICYLKGIGVKQDYEQGVKWLLKAAEQGNAKAYFNLGFCYENGIGVSQNFETAKYYYRIAANYGHKKASESLEKLE